MIVLIYEKGDTYEMDYSLIYDPFPDKKEDISDTVSDLSNSNN